MTNSNGRIGMRAPRSHIRIRIDRWLHPGGHRVLPPQNCKLFLDSFPEMDNNHNPSRRRCSIRLLRRTGRHLDSDPEGRPRRIWDRTPPTRTTTTMGFFNLPRIHTRPSCELRNRTSNLMSTPFYALCFLLAFSHSLTFFPPFLYLSSL